MKTLAIAVASALTLADCAVAEPYDTDMKWIRQTLRQQHQEERSAAVDHYRRHRPHYRAPVVHREHHTYRPQVYGMVMRRADTMVRDATGHVECFPALEARSHERQSADGAWDDAQRSWENTVRWKYGERYMAIANASAIEKRCNVSTVSESIAGKIVEAAREAVGADSSGRRWRCEVRAAPCVAPAEITPATRGATE